MVINGSSIDDDLMMQNAGGCDNHCSPHSSPREGESGCSKSHKDRSSGWFETDIDGGRGGQHQPFGM
uniref:Uncharacterized protein n=1 Tax=Romanomermis culicivorax TaxID=13658 RepID=A0A915HPK0_ROMCU